VCDSRRRARIQRPPPPAGSKLLSTPRVPEPVLVPNQLAMWLKALWPSVLYLLDDPSGARSDGGGSATQAPLPLARLWACLYLAVRARVGSGRGSFSASVSVLRIPR